ncbi:MAG: anti-sigma regulatory factor [Omnitrophica WOR_2 bacterium]
MATTILKNEVMNVHSSEDIIHVRQMVRLWAVQLGFGLVSQTKFVTATSELARNMLDFGGGGTVQMEELDNSNRQGLRLIFEDHGPGIANLEMAMKDGFTTGNGLGLGLGGSKRLVDEFEIVSRSGEGTRVTITTWK